MRLAPARTASLALFLSATCAAAASAQQQPAPRFASVVKGDTVRISVFRPSSGWTMGTIVWTATDSLGFNRREQRDTIALGRDNIALLEVKRGKRPLGGGATAGGALAGGLLGLLVGGFTGTKLTCSSNCAEEGIGSLGGILGGATVGLVVGMVAGGTYGSRRTTENWVPVSP